MSSQTKLTCPISYLSAAIITGLLSGCAIIPSIGPSYEEPSVKIPERFDVLGEKGREGPLVAQTVALAGWWKQFNDPVLTALIERSTASNFDIRIAESRVREARALAGVSTGKFLPSIDGSGAFSRTKVSPDQFGSGQFGDSSSQSFTNSPRNLYSAGFDASWEVDIFGGLRREREAALAQLEAADASLADARITFLAETAREYLATRSLEKRLEIARKNVQTQQESLDLVRSRFEAGLVSELDVAQAQTSLEQTRATIPALAQEYSASLNRLSVLGAISLQELRELLAQSKKLTAGSSVAKLPESLPVGLPSELLRRRPDIRAAERELAAATANIGVAVADWFPRFSFTGNFGVASRKSGSLFESKNEGWGVSPAVRWPIFAGGRIVNNIRVQNERQQQALASYEKTVLAAFAETEQVLTAHVQQLERFASLARALDASNRALELSQELYQQGVTDFQRVLDAQRQVFSSEDLLAASEQDLLTGVVSIYKTLGGDWGVTMTPSVTPSESATSAQPAK